MRTALLVLIALAVAAVLVWRFGPREPVVTAVAFDESLLADGVESHLLRAEADVPNLRPGAQKRVLWADRPEARTGWAVVYLHGFSATSEEVRPLPDKVADALGANLVFTRLTGHGRDGSAMAEGSVQAWMQDVAEALAIGRAVGDRVLVMGTSTGGTLATLALHEDMGRDVAGVVLVSPNFEVNNPAAFLLTAPYARRWLPWVIGPQRGFEPQNAGHAAWWTTRYPSVAVLPMAASVQAARALPHERVETPALFVFDDRDTVVRAQATRAVAALWGAPAEVAAVTIGADDDPAYHVIAGDILSPGMTDMLVQRITAWAQGL